MGQVAGVAVFELLDGLGEKAVVGADGIDAVNGVGFATARMGETGDGWAVADGAALWWMKVDGEKTGGTEIVAGFMAAQACNWEEEVEEGHGFNF